MNLSCVISAKRELLAKARIYAVLLVLCLVFALSSPVFCSKENFVNILLASATIGLLSIGSTFVIAARGLDLSIGSVLGLSGAAAAYLALKGVPWPLVAAACLAVGPLVGLINGTIIARLNIPAFIVTLGMLSIARGGALIITDGRPIYGLPEQILFFGRGAFLGLPAPVWLFLLCGMAMHTVLRKTAFGSRTLSLGDNEKAVFNAGINVTALKTALYMLSGFFASLGALVFMGRVNAADPSAGLMYELTAITAAILGGAHLTGGRASVAGAMVGALIMGVLQNGLTLLAVPSYYQQVAIGAILILAVLMDRFMSEGT